jgi:AmmeMemoRadiSam system protein B
MTRGWEKGPPQVKRSRFKVSLKSHLRPRLSCRLMVDAARIFRFLVILFLAGLIGLGYFSGGASQEPPAGLLTPPAPPTALYLQSFFQSRELYEEAFAGVGPVSQVRIRAGIVSHHFLARKLIARFFAGLDPEGVACLILLSPDHYHRLVGRPELWVTTREPWQTPYGVLKADGPVIDSLLASGAGALNDDAFRQEHGAYLLIPFIKRTFPRALIVPIILRGNPDFTRLAQWGAQLKRAAPPGTVLLVSSDFAHGVDAAGARRLDRESLFHLRQLRLPDLKKIHSDFRPGLAALAGFLGTKPRDFLLVSHRTSADFGSREPANLTSYIAAYYRETAAPTLSLLFLGDLMCDRGIREVAEARGFNHLFQGLEALLTHLDLTIANLEGPITPFPSLSRGRRPQERNHYLFTFPPALAGVLKRQDINLVHLGNNHILDFGPEGLAQTRKYLKRAGVDWFGDPLGGTRRWVLKRLPGLRLALVSHNQFSGPGVENTLADLKEARARADLVIVYAHWGGEYRLEPGEGLRQLAHRFIEAGADLIVGSHSHTVQPWEDYGGKRIYYSLGNFIFDQAGRDLTRRGLALLVQVNSANLGLTFKEIPLFLEKNGQTVLNSQ